MSQVICRHCNNSVLAGTQHYCVAMQQAGVPPTQVPNRPDGDDDSCFITSVTIALSTDSAVIGTILGGNPVGAVVGEVLSSTDDVKANQPANDEATTEPRDHTETSDESDEDNAPDDDDD